MKPDPQPVRNALRLVGSSAGRAVLVGDAVTDIRAARAAGVAAVGYANRPTKRGILASADAVIESMSERRGGARCRRRGGVGAAARPVPREEGKGRAAGERG
ncbi:HAD hydrolase-like protein [Pilimelia anulata]|uniref:HAD hydrolase-like protein n=1 Tax=Pilimelia anulata TaxID=53371 RepID=UPI001E59F474|nr:HAD hydrolase-like protein [Pilimelia anulata]